MCRTCCMLVCMRTLGIHWLIFAVGTRVFAAETEWSYSLDELLLCREKDKAASDVEATTGQVKQAQDVVPPMERLVHGLEQQQAETMK